MATYTVQCLYALYYGAVVTVDAGTPEEACSRAIALANDNGGAWKALDQPGPTFVERMAVGARDDPWDAPASDGIAVPARFTELGVLAPILPNDDVAAG
jgi:hypothetical protein